ncbi:HEAT repeat protein-like protein [Lophiotrema nucula]|uniref:HEAT repeat protein-like protein n=1 Tax=Lophiotrema nucula TaxID=690887 RepID=A0A6A5YIM2_9PLEO|nr:HEAT repeat protein-like protein [Lophiotrema nucula]
MAYTLVLPTGTIPEKTLRDVSQNLLKFLPDFAGKEEAQVLKSIRDVLVPLLDTSDVADLSPSHRAAATNALCAVIEHCQQSGVIAARCAILDEVIWFRLLDIYLQRSDNAKGKSMRQLLLLLTGLLQKESSLQTTTLRERAISTFIDIIYLRQDRLKVKPALQGLSHFLQKGVVSIPGLLQHFQRYSSGRDESTIKDIFNTLLGWVVHHDTALSAGHMIKNFLSQLRQCGHMLASEKEPLTWPFWMEPVVETLHSWPDRIQEFKTHVFPHCFLPNLTEYFRFLSYLHFDVHVVTRSKLPNSLLQSSEAQSILSSTGEFRVLLAAIETGKQLGIIKDVDYRNGESLVITDDAICLPDSIFGEWLSHPDPEVRVAGLFLSVYSTAGTKPITSATFKSLKHNIVHLHTDIDANFRKDVLNHTQRLFDRLRGSTAALARPGNKNNMSSGQRQDIGNFLSRSKRSDPASATDQLLLGSLSFMRWYVQFLNRELRPTASYQRRATALRCLTILLKSGIDPSVPHQHLSKSAQGQLQWSHKLQVVTPKLIRLLLDLVLDAFDDVRGASASLLTLCLESLSEAEKDRAVLELVDFIRRAESMMLSSGRADQADGVARAVALLFTQCSKGSSNEETLQLGEIQKQIDLSTYLTSQLDETLLVVRKDMADAVNGRPVHGIFAALRYIVDSDIFYTDIISLSNDELHQWRELHGRMSTAIDTLWSCIRDVLCADAPEGHVPEELEEEQSLDTKEILSYSWRGLKEASVLLRSIVSKAPIGTSDTSILTPADFEKMGKQCFTQLVELRHRGAFSTVAQTFAAFCRRCFLVDDPALRALPEKWYEEALRSIQDKATAITRRSAGIPALVSGVLAAEPQPGGKMFARAMKDLIAEASLTAVSSNIEESRLPQVHALNCIKEIFTSSKLSAVSEAYIGEGLNLAARNLNSSIWPIRNCSLMLFKALIERLLGSDEAQDWTERERAKTSRFSYENYPSLVGILTDLLDPNGALKKSMTTIVDSSSPMDLHGAEGVFPALQILRQATPPESHRLEIMSSVSYLLGSPHWHLRDMAARTLVSLKRPEECFNGALGCLSDLDTTQNMSHGLLLSLKYALRKLLRPGHSIPAERFDTMLFAMLDAVPKVNRSDTSPFVYSAFLDIVNICGLSIFPREANPESTLQAWCNLSSSLRLPEAITNNSGMSDSLLETSSKQGFFIDHLIVRPRIMNYRADILSMADLPDVLLRLAREDPDTCSTILDTLADTIPKMIIESPTVLKHKLAYQILQGILSTADEEVRSKAQLVLADVLLDEQLRVFFFNCVSIEELANALELFETQCLESSPSNMQGALRLLGSFLDFTFAIRTRIPGNRTTGPALSVFAKFARYIRLLRMVIIDTNPFDARLSAVQSLLTLQTIFTAPTVTEPTRTTLLGLAIVLYDLLNDDDDEIRDRAATATHTLLSSQSQNQNPSASVSVSNLKPTVPLLMTRRLAAFLVTHFQSSPQLSKIAMNRLGGGLEIPGDISVFAREFGDVLSEAMVEDTSLFVKERQNLFKDDTLDVLFWTKILSSLPPPSSSTKLSRSPVEALQVWTSDALAALTQTAHHRSDRALGWTSKLEVFTLIMRLLCLAEVLLSWNVAGSAEIVMGLDEFAVAGAQSGIHPVLLERVERLVKKSVVERLRGVKGGLDGVVKALG